MQMLLAGEMFAVVPLSSCPHLVRVQHVPECGIDCMSPCSECGCVQENWVCLVCYSVSMQTLEPICHGMSVYYKVPESEKYSHCLQVHCGRYINGHMMLHAHSASHPLTLSFSDLSVWCYVCEAYIDNQVSCTVLALVQSEEWSLTIV
jgi:histone deacetylase 6